MLIDQLKLGQKAFLTGGQWKKEPVTITEIDRESNTLYPIGVSFRWGSGSSDYFLYANGDGCLLDGTRLTQAPGDIPREYLHKHRGI